MNGREIPGYYFDTTKNKYFKIQANHIAPQGSQYSKQNVKKIREQERQEREHHLHSEAVRLQRVKRSAILQSPWAGLRLDCERQCDAGRRCETGITMFGAGLRHAYRLAMVNGVITACMDVEDSGGWLIGDSAFSFRCTSITIVRTVGTAGIVHGSLLTRRSSSLPLSTI